MSFQRLHFRVRFLEGQGGTSWPLIGASSSTPQREEQVLGRPAAGVSVHCALSWTFAYLSPGEVGLEKTHGTIFKFHVYWFSSAFACCFLIFLQPGKCLVQNLYPNQRLFVPCIWFQSFILSCSVPLRHPIGPSSAPVTLLWKERLCALMMEWLSRLHEWNEWWGPSLDPKLLPLETADSSGASIQAVFFPPWNLHRISL